MRPKSPDRSGELGGLYAVKGAGDDRHRKRRGCIFNRRGGSVFNRRRSQWISRGWPTFQPAKVAHFSTGLDSPDSSGGALQTPVSHPREGRSGRRKERPALIGKAGSEKLLDTGGDVARAGRNNSTRALR